LFFGFLDLEDSGIKLLCNACGILVINMLSCHKDLGHHQYRFENLKVRNKVMVCCSWLCNTRPTSLLLVTVCCMSQVWQVLQPCLY